MDNDGGYCDTFSSPAVRSSVSTRPAKGDVDEIPVRSSPKRFDLHWRRPVAVTLRLFLTSSKEIESTIPPGQRFVPV